MQGGETISPWMRGSDLLHLVLFILHETPQPTVARWYYCTKIPSTQTNHWWSAYLVVHVTCNPRFHKITANY